MSIVFSCAVSHAPGMTAWANAAPEAQRDRLTAGFASLREQLAASGAETLILLTSEHWANFFLDHIGAFCIGRAERYPGPVEPWLNVGKAELAGDPGLANALLEASYEGGIEPSFAYEMEFDHGTMVPLHFLAPKMDHAVLPIMFNTLAAPQPTARRCFAFGKIIGEVARRSAKRIGLVATGGLSHDPGERNHGLIDSEFDHAFLKAMAEADTTRLAAYKSSDFAAAGAGAFELLSWVALAGAMDGARGEILAYEAVKPWATGIGLMSFAA